MFTELYFIAYQIYYQQPIFWYINIAILGAIFGSFITMMCHRLPIMLEWIEQPTDKQTPTLNLYTPRSLCPHCKNTLSWWQNIPLFSYLILNGKCHFCKHKIPMTYFLIELSCVCLSVMTAIIINHPIYGLWWCVFVWIALSLIVLDYRYLLLPDSLNYSLLWTGLLFSVVLGKTEIAIISACIGYTSFFIINALYKWLRKRDGIGQGDFKLLAGIAVWIGWYELPSAILISSSLGLSYALILFIKHKTIDLKLAIPYAPFLLAGAWLWEMYLNISHSIPYLP